MGHLVLVVEDSPQCASNLEIALVSVPGLRVATARSGQEALDFLRRRGQAPVSAIITDLEMPRVDGFELIEQVRSDRRLRRVPIIAVSGSTDPETPQRARRLGADAFFAKPYSPSEVRNQLEQFLNANPS